MTGSGVDKSWMVSANTLHAESRTQSRGVGFPHFEGTEVAIAASIFPGSQTRVATNDIRQNNGPALEVPGAAFGPVALSATDQGAYAVAASDSMYQAQPQGTPGTSRGSTLRTFNPSTLGAAAKGTQVLGASVGMQLPPPGSFSESDRGDGPNAISSAGEAVAASYSSQIDVTQPVWGKLDH